MFQPSSQKNDWAWNTFWCCNSGKNSPISGTYSSYYNKAGTIENGNCTEQLATGMGSCCRIE